MLNDIKTKTEKRKTKNGFQILTSLQLCLEYLQKHRYPLPKFEVYPDHPVNFTGVNVFLEFSYAGNSFVINNEFLPAEKGKKISEMKSVAKIKAYQALLNYLESNKITKPESDFQGSYTLDLLEFDWVRYDKGAQDTIISLMGTDLSLKITKGKHEKTLPFFNECKFDYHSYKYFFEIVKYFIEKIKLKNPFEGEMCFDPDSYIEYGAHSTQLQVPEINLYYDYSLNEAQVQKDLKTTYDSMPAFLKDIQPFETIKWGYHTTHGHWNGIDEYNRYHIDVTMPEWEAFKKQNPILFEENNNKFLNTFPYRFLKWGLKKLANVS